MSVVCCLFVFVRSLLSVVRCWWVFAVCSLLPIGVCRRFVLKMVDCCLSFVVVRWLLFGVERCLMVVVRGLGVVCCLLIAV